MSRTNLLYRLIHIAALCIASAALAQEPSRTPEVPLSSGESQATLNSGSILFDRNLNTTNWIGRVLVDTALLTGTRIRYRQQFLSNIIQLEPTGGIPGKRLLSDQHTLAVLLAQPVSHTLDVRTDWSSLTYTDNKNIGLNDAAFATLLGGLRYSPFSFISLTPMGGYRWDNQAGINDAGPSVNLEARADRIVTDGYMIQGIGQYHTDFVNPRRLESHFARFRVSKDFSGGASDSLIAGFARNRREFYVAGDSLIESRQEEILSVTNFLNYQVSGNVATGILVNFAGRGLDKGIRATVAAAEDPARFSTTIDEYVLEAAAQATYRSDDGRSTGAVRFSYAERNEAHTAVLPPNPSAGTVLLFAERNRQEQTKDNLTRRSMLTGFLSAPLSLTDRIALSGSVSILRYDTPSPLNLEDRDELLAALTLATQHRFGSFFELGVALEGSISHLVYLLKERSANNNVNRILRLAPRAIYTPTRWFSTTNVFEVLANYTVYDYEKQVALVRSFSYRQFAWMDSTRLEFTRSLGLDFFLYFKLYERGLLAWNEFTERIENSFADQTYDVLIRFIPYPGTVFGIGGRYFSQSRYQHEGAERTLQTFLRSIGPTCVVTWAIGTFSSIRVRGWLEHRTQPDGSVRRLANVTMNIAANF